jgi:aspartate carbamoyltransferase catalytic subunit
MNRGLEISAAAADSPRSTVREQVANGVSVRMAALYLLLSGGDQGGRRIHEEQKANEETPANGGAR